MPCLCGDSECPSCGLAQGTLEPTGHAIYDVMDRLDWQTVEPPEVTAVGGLHAVKEGHFMVGDCRVDCLILNNGQRIITEESLERLFGIADLPGGAT